MNNQIKQFSKFGLKRKLFWAISSKSLPVLSFHISYTVTPERDPCAVDECTYDVLMSLFSV